MKNLKVYTIIAVLVMACLVFGAYRQGSLHAEAAVAPAKVAVVNVTEVMKNSKRFKTWQEAKQLEAKQIEAELKAMQSELEALNENLKIRTPGSEDHQKAGQGVSLKNAPPCRAKTPPTKSFGKVRKSNGPKSCTRNC